MCRKVRYKKRKVKSLTRTVECECAIERFHFATTRRPGESGRLHGILAFFSRRARRYVIAASSSARTGRQGGARARSTAHGISPRERMSRWRAQQQTQVASIHRLPGRLCKQVRWNDHLEFGIFAGLYVWRLRSFPAASATTDWMARQELTPLSNK